MTKRLGVWLLLIGLGLAACTSDRPPKDPSERSTTDLYMLKGVQYMENGRLDIAQQDLQRAIDLDEKNVDAHNAMGVLYERLGRPTDAEEQFKRALALDSDNSGAANNYGRVLCAQGKYQEAMQQFRRVIDSKHNNAPWIALTNAGICAKNQGLAQDAEGYLRKALEVGPNFPPALLEMAKFSLEKGSYLSARAFLQRFEAVAQPSSESLSIGMQTEQALGNAKEANAYLKKLQSLFPNSQEARRSRKGHHSAD